MTRNRTMILMTITLAAALCAVPTGTFAETVRLPAGQVDRLAELGIVPVRNLDYGSFHWLELEDGDLQRLEGAGLGTELVRDTGIVQVLDYRFDPRIDGEPKLERAEKASATGTGLHLLQLVAPLRPEWADHLHDLGIELLQYYPHHTYLVWLSPSQLEAVHNLSFVRWEGSFHPAYKIDPGLDARTGTIRNVDVMFFADDRPERTLDALRDLDARILQSYPSQPDRAFFNAIVELEADAVDAVARLDHVLWLGYQSPEPLIDDEMSSQIVAGNHPDGVPEPGYFDHLAALGFDGSSVIWATVDTGVDYAHPDLNSRIVGGFTFPGAPAGSGPGDDCSSGGHGTHVTGIIGGDATAGYSDADGFLYGLGMAPEYSILALNSLCSSSWPPVGGWQEHSKRAVLGNAVGGNNSWTSGEGTHHGYQATERTHDIMVRDGNFDTPGAAEPFIEVFSAGNSGTGGLTSPKEAKNLIVTAGTQNYRVSGDIDAMYGSSSRGPAEDGRWVPTIAAPAQSIASAHRQGGASQCTSTISGTNGLYSWCTGTSMAAPHTSGSIVLITEWWRTFNAGTNPSPAMAKALLVNTAVDIGTPDIPNANEGWGRINVTDVIQPDVLREYRDQETVFDTTGEVFTLVIGVPDPLQPLKISLAWSDAPGAVGADPALVNNLDLEVETDGVTYLGNDFSGGWSTTGGGADTINNLENVFVPAPGGQATIRVIATHIAGDGVPLVGDDTDQDFALVCSNCSETPDFFMTAAPANLEVCAPQDAQYQVDIDTILGFSDEVTLSASGAPTGTTAAFDPNPVTPPGASTLTISDTGAAVPGHSELTVTGLSSTSMHESTIGLDVFTASPTAPELIAPAQDAANVPARPTFQWSAVDQAGSYTVQVATDEQFSDLILNETGIAGTTLVPMGDLPTNTHLFWRVMTSNGCGVSPYSNVRHFVTVALPGDCSLGSTTIVHFEDDIESGDGLGWSHGGTGDSWRIATARTHSGDYSFHSTDVSAVSDQWLASGDIILPTDQTPITLQFWNWQEIEEETSTSCYDGALLEISTDGGASWNHVTTGFETAPYDGAISTCCSNPLALMEAWCGDPRDWHEVVVNLDDYAGQTVRFRFRLGTDISVGREGWYIDDVVVQSCSSESPGTVFSDGFETGDSSRWSEAVD